MIQHSYMIVHSPTRSPFCPEIGNLLSNGVLNVLGKVFEVKELTTGWLCRGKASVCVISELLSHATVGAHQSHTDHRKQSNDPKVDGNPGQRLLPIWTWLHHVAGSQEVLRQRGDEREKKLRTRGVHSERV